jgi:hypothetical protein
LRQLVSVRIFASGSFGGRVGDPGASPGGMSVIVSFLKSLKFVSFSQSQSQSQSLKKKIPRREEEHLSMGRVSNSPKPKRGLPF